MSYTLSKLLQDAYKSLGQLQVAKAKGGGDSTILDSKLAEGSKDDDWNGGTVIVIQAGGSAPEGEFARVTDYTASTGTISMTPLTAAVQNNDVYGLAGPHYPLRDMIELANAALRELGDIPLVDTSLTTAEQQTEYTCATAWKRRPPFRIDIQTRTEHASDHGWQTIYWWQYIPATAGATGLLVFDRQLEPGRSLRVWYQDGHPRVNEYSDVIYEGIAPALAAAALVEMALRWKVSQIEGENIFMLQRWNDAKNELERMKAIYPIWKPQPQARMRLAGIRS